MNKPVPSRLANRPLHPRAAQRARVFLRELDENLGTGNFFSVSSSMIDKLRLLASEYYKLLDEHVQGVQDVRDVQEEEDGDPAEGYR